jgi:hypothetical protein
MSDVKENHLLRPYAGIVLRAILRGEQPENFADDVRAEKNKREAFSD